MINEYGERDDRCGPLPAPGIIYQSADTTLNFQLQTSDGKPFDLTSATEIWAMFPTVSENGVPVILKLSESKLTVTNSGGGEFSGVMTSANAFLLTTGLISIEVRVTINDEVSVVEMPNALNVVASLFPGY